MSPSFSYILNETIYLLNFGFCRTVCKYFSILYMERFYIPYNFIVNYTNDITLPEAIQDDDWYNWIYLNCFVKSMGIQLFW